MKILRLAVIVGSLPNTLTNGTTADATQVMADLNFIVNQVNANAAPLATTALTNANNNFTVVQSGTAASQAANFPIASQVQNQVFNTLTSTLGTNAITARCAALPLSAYASGQVFTFTPSQTNTGPANITVDAAGSSIIFQGGATLIGGELRAGIPTRVEYDGAKLNLLAPEYSQGTWTPSVGGTATYNNQSGSYTKLGRMVFFDLDMTINNIGSGSTGTISGLPFTCNQTNFGVLTVGLWSSTANTFVYVTGTIGTSGTTITLQNATAATATIGNTPFFQNSARIVASGMYHV